jgi:mannose-1-phosphate guanylyltransferase
MGVRDGVVGLFPCDHYYRDAATFGDALSAAYDEANRSSGTVVLLGAPATRPETQYGWIEPGPVLSLKTRPGEGPWEFRGVRRFVEKPSESLAAALMARAGLWNTLVTIGQLSALESLVAAARPELWTRAQVLGLPRGVGGDDSRASAEVYAHLTAADFSRDALAAFPDRLRVMVLPDLGWTDLGHPDRVAAVLADRRLVLPSPTQIAG